MNGRTPQPTSCYAFPAVSNFLKKRPFRLIPSRRLLGPPLGLRLLLVPVLIGLLTLIALLLLALLVLFSHDVPPCFS
jgi:hypothetical protein